MSRRLSLAVLIALGAGGMVAAQPSGAPQAPPQSGPAQGTAPAPPPVVEEAPPISVPTPQPVVVPPIDEKEVAPAPPQNATAPAEAKKAPEAPQHRARFDMAVLQALDKVTAETLRFEAPVGKPIRYKTLVFTVRACERSMPDEPIEDSIAYVEVLSQPRPEPGRPALPPRQAFKGWMFASSPGLNPFEHPVYAAWLISCRAATPAPAPAPAAAR
ncbi:DUF2155 domain-containing protein [Phenylobacterium sp.]|uniref:DUF2155 domain-containing protein n=1 Tax=Phenylobacterium sp. TaxID=1871053 RepID=UPI002617102B|nr:DUF2155 domain-containing protein [Phenylobacterium sp.]